MDARTAREERTQGTAINNRGVQMHDGRLAIKDHSEMKVRRVVRDWGRGPGGFPGRSGVEGGSVLRILAWQAVAETAARADR